MNIISDFPLAWDAMRRTDPQQHHEKCSYRQTNGAILCDCAAEKVLIAVVDLINEGNFRSSTPKPHENN